MNNRESVRSVLTDAGFSQYEAMVFLSVLELGEASVAEIAENSTVPRSRIYDVLRDLEQQGYLETFEGDTLRARVREPDTVVDRLNDRANNFTDAAEQIEDVWEQPPASQSAVQVFQTHEATLERARDHLPNTEHILHLAVSPEELELMRDILEPILDQDTIVRISLHKGLNQDSDLSNLDIAYSEIASEVKRCTSVSPFIALIDGRTMVFGIQSHRGSEYGLAVEDHILSSIMHWYFQIQLWEPWDTVYSASAPDDMTYVSIRELIRDLESIPESDETVRVRVEGTKTYSGELVDITGTVTDIVYTDAGTRGTQPFGQPFIQAAIVVDDGTEEYTIGGYGAILEDIRAVRVRVLSIE